MHSNERSESRLRGIMVTDASPPSHQGKKVYRLVAEEEKLNSRLARKKNSTQILCRGPTPQIINGPSLMACHCVSDTARIIQT